MRFSNFYAFLEGLAPRELSAVWDNDGVMCLGDRELDVKRVLVALDPTSSAIKYASDNGFDVLLTHHPMIFKGLKSLTGADTVSARTISALMDGVAVVSLHTRLDAAEGGVNDALMDALGIKVTGVFGDSEMPTLGRLGELEEAIDAADLALRVRDSLDCGRVRVTGKGTVRRIAAVGGDGKDFVLSAIKAGADVLITGDAGYNTCEAAAEDGFVIIEAGHFHTEDPVCRALAEKLRGIGLEAETFSTCPSMYV